jgi:hypothetical protein
MSESGHFRPIRPFLPTGRCPLHPKIRPEAGEGNGDAPSALTAPAALDRRIIVFFVSEGDQPPRILTRALVDTNYALLSRHQRYR